MIEYHLSEVLGCEISLSFLSFEFPFLNMTVPTCRVRLFSLEGNEIFFKKGTKSRYKRSKSEEAEEGKLYIYIYIYTSVLPIFFIFHTVVI